MTQMNVDVVEAYYKAMESKDLSGMSRYLHPNVRFLGPLAELTGRDVILEAVGGLFPLFKNIVIRAKCSSDTQVMFAYDLNCVEPMGTLRVAALMTLEEELITRIELFFDARPFFEK
jgi:hypothetical protein